MLKPGEVPLRLTDDAVKPATGFPPLMPTARLKWTGDNRIFFMADRRGESFQCSVSAEGGPLHYVCGGGVQMAAVSYDAATKSACALCASPYSPVDIRWVGLTDGVTRQLTDYNRAYLNEHPPAKLRKSSFSRGDTSVESRVWLPPGFDETKKYPMILEVHGGPNAAFYDAFTPIHQVLATAGYVVLAVNPRGSASYGNDFTMAVLGDWGGEDYLDIMAAVDEMTSRQYVDSSRLGIHGYSYGGFMTSWTIGHTNRFKAAVVGAPCTNLSSLYGTSDIGVAWGEHQWGGMRKDNLDVYYEHSPITYAPNVTTPVLLLHGESDVRCPIEQSEQYFVALKRLGKEAEFIRFPNCSHLFTRQGHPKMREEYLSRMLAWFKQRL
jgi:dipeptidyl aminopeptidase/acylaminoacyl peptidase